MPGRTPRRRLRQTHRDGRFFSSSSLYDAVIKYISVQNIPDTSPNTCETGQEPIKSAHIPRRVTRYLLPLRLCQGAQTCDWDVFDQAYMSRGAGEIWRGMSEAERLPYIELAREEKQTHARQHPNYRYAPGIAKGIARKGRKPKLPRRPSRATSDSSEVSLAKPTLGQLTSPRLPCRLSRAGTMYMGQLAIRSAGNERPLMRIEFEALQRTLVLPSVGVGAFPKQRPLAVHCLINEFLFHVLGRGEKE
ncbi:hypothetical protein B0H13DRAFT_1661023 [Mycena leptocephala]|nr:hypothetical protein B0H13DRAFT_1661023 [Mycena leptocephala]